MQWPLWSIVGHIPRNISAACSLFLQCAGQISCTITGSRRYSDDLPQEGLELLSLYTFRGDSKLTGKLRKVFKLEEHNTCTPPSEKKMKTVIEIEDDDKLDTAVVKPWVTCFGIRLFQSDTSTLLSEELTDLHIDLAQEILNKYHWVSVYVIGVYTEVQPC